MGETRLGQGCRLGDCARLSVRYATHDSCLEVYDTVVAGLDDVRGDPPSEPCQFAGTRDGVLVDVSTSPQLREVTVRARHTNS